MDVHTDKNNVSMTILHFLVVFFCPLAFVFCVSRERPHEVFFCPLQNPFYERTKNDDRQIETNMLEVCSA